MIRAGAAAFAFAVALLGGCVPEDSYTRLEEHACPDGGTELSYANFGAPFMDAHCQRCHASAAEDRHGAPTTFTFDSRAEIARHKERIFARAAADNVTMPPGPDDPPAEERALLAEWLACGAP